MSAMVDDKEEAMVFEARKSALALKYTSRAQSCLDRTHPSHKNYNPLKIILEVLNAKKPKGKMTIKSFDHIENFLEKIFKPKVMTIDLTNDSDDSDCQPILDFTVEKSNRETNSRSCFNVNAQSTLDTSVNEAISPVEQGASSSSPSHQVSQLTAISSTRIPTSVPVVSKNRVNEIPLPKEDLPTLSALDLDDCQEIPTAEPAPKVKARRLSVHSRPASSKDIPSIADYKLKQNKLVPPSVYAKPKEQESEMIPRETITVPYKTDPRPAQPYDPSEHAIRIEGIKEKIFANHYLKLEARKKIEMVDQEIAKQKTLESESQNSNDPELDLNGNVANEKENGSKLSTKRGRGRPRKQEEARTKKKSSTSSANKVPKQTNERPLTPLSKENVQPIDEPMDVTCKPVSSRSVTNEPNRSASANDENSCGIKTNSAHPDALMTIAPALENVVAKEAHPSSNSCVPYKLSQSEIARIKQSKLQQAESHAEPKASLIPYLCTSSISSLGKRRSSEDLFTSGKRGKSSEEQGSSEDQTADPLENSNDEDPEDLLVEVQGKRKGRPRQKYKLVPKHRRKRGRPKKTKVVIKEEPEEESPFSE